MSKTPHKAPQYQKHRATHIRFLIFSFSNTEQENGERPLADCQFLEKKTCPSREAQVASDEVNKPNWDLPSIPLIMHWGGEVWQDHQQEEVDFLLGSMRHGTYTQEQWVLQIERTLSWFNVAVTMYIL